MTQTRRKPKQKRALEKYEAILDACTVVLQEKGYKQTTVLEISLESEVAIPTIYQYFSSKEEIFDVWVERVTEQIAQAVETTAATIETEDLPTFINQLLSTGLLMVEQFGPSMRNFMAELPQYVVSQIIEKAITKLTALIASLQEKYPFDAVTANTPQRITIMVRAIMGYLLQTVMTEEKEIETKDLIAELNILVNSYFNAPAPE